MTGPLSTPESRSLFPAPPLDVPPSEYEDSDPPPGYHFEWTDDEGSRAATPEEFATKKCRRPKCDGSPVMALLRGGAYAPQWWLYCGLHLYGRRIENGVVQSRRLVKDDDG